MNHTAYFHYAAELVKSIAEHIANNEHSIILINDLGDLSIVPQAEGIDTIKDALEQRLVEKKEELYETLASFLPTTTPETKKNYIDNLQGVFKKINESRFYAL